MNFIVYDAEEILTYLSPLLLSLMKVSVWEIIVNQPEVHLSNWQSVAFEGASFQRNLTTKVQISLAENLFLSNMRCLLFSPLCLFCLISMQKLADFDTENGCRRRNN